jgi:ABC-type sugar transport system permease subunit
VDCIKFLLTRANFAWHPNTALLRVALMRLWRVGDSGILYLAGLLNVPPYLYEAAEMDGAGFWAKLFNVILPMLTPTLFFQR